MENTLKQIKTAFLNAHTSQEDLVCKLWEKADAWTTWIIGFAVGGLALLAGNLDKFKNRLSNDEVHEIFIWLFVAISAGILFRYIYLWFYQSLLLIHRRLRYDFDTTADIPIYPVLTEKTTFAELVYIVKEYTGEDFNNMLSEFAEAEEKKEEIKKQALWNLLSDYYFKAQTYNSLQVQKGLDFVDERYISYFGKSLKDFKDDSRYKRLYGFKFWTIAVIGGILFLALTISLLIAFFIFSFNVHI